MIRQLYLDSANLDDIRKYVQTDAIAGVTTNPSLMAKEAKGLYVPKLLDICNTIQDVGSSCKHLSVEVTTLDPEGMYEQALIIAEALGGLSKVDVHIKIPLMARTLNVITKLRDAKVKVNATAIMTPLQAKMAEDAGAPVVSFFYNRMLDAAEDADGNISHYVRNLRRSASIICGSIRKTDDVRKCWLAGAEFVTASPEIIEAMAFHKATREAVDKFQKDIDAWLE